MRRTGLGGRVARVCFGWFASVFGPFCIVHGMAMAALFFCYFFEVAGSGTSIARTRGTLRLTDSVRARRYLANLSTTQSAPRSMWMIGHSIRSQWSVLPIDVSSVS
ncbi:hypothetical protein GE21DRAFT_1202592 [Neurospora crassa]|nr:hypothetical protein B13N20.170 [imported] - Neurospora crassa [Neurospora crassa]KHE87153.1 hypothetical protein GE21DRAFT_1202592 [Neurospora crassa]